MGLGLCLLGHAGRRPPRCAAAACQSGPVHWQLRCQCGPPTLLLSASLADAEKKEEAKEEKKEKKEEKEEEAHEVRLGWGRQRGGVPASAGGAHGSCLVRMLEGCNQHARLSHSIALALPPCSRPQEL